MSYELFWELCPHSLSPFVKAFSIIQTQKDVDMWRQGAYIRDAIGSCLSKEYKYPQKPYGYEVTITDEEKEQEMRMKFLNHVERINKQFQ